MDPLTPLKTGLPTMHLLFPTPQAQFGPVSTNTLFQVLFWKKKYFQSPLRCPRTPTSSTNTSASSMVISLGSQTLIILKQRLHQDPIRLMIPGGNNTRSFFVLVCFFLSFRWLSTTPLKILSLLKILNPFNIWLAEVRAFLWGLLKRWSESLKFLLSLWYKPIQKKILTDLIL